MASYRVVWEIDVEADDFVEAAEEAFSLVQGNETTATCFTVVNQQGFECQVDLQFEDQRAKVTNHLGEVTYQPL